MGTERFRRASINDSVISRHLCNLFNTAMGNPVAAPVARADEYRDRSARGMKRSMYADERKRVRLHQCMHPPKEA